MEAEGGDLASVGWATLLERLPQLPQGDELRIEAINLARRFANPNELAAKAKDEQARWNHQRLHVAWQILQATETLRPGMRFEDLVALLGKPTARYPGAARWAYSSMMHVNPALDVEINSKQQVVAIRFIRV